MALAWVAAPASACSTTDLLSIKLQTRCEQNITKTKGIYNRCEHDVWYHSVLFPLTYSYSYTTYSAPSLKGVRRTAELCHLERSLLKMKAKYCLKNPTFELNRKENRCPVICSSFACSQWFLMEVFGQHFSHSRLKQQVQFFLVCDPYYKRSFACELVIKGLIWIWISSST